jgi:hypothetical protein
MNDSKQNEDEPVDHYELRFLLEEAKPIFSMSLEKQKEWVAESKLAQEIYTILSRHPEYYDEFRRCWRNLLRTELAYKR